MTDLRPGVRALRLPEPHDKCSRDNTVCRVTSFPFLGRPATSTTDTRTPVLVCETEELDGSNYSPRDGWPAAYLLPLWDRDEDQTVEHEKEVVT